MSSSIKNIDGIIDNFVKWLENFGELSQDHQDYLSGWYGGYAKDKYYRNPRIGHLLVAPMIFCEAFLPNTRALFKAKSRLPIADAHYAMAYSYLFQGHGNEQHYDRAVHFLEVLKDTRCPDFKNYCWGYPFDWVTVYGTFPQGTPMITATPYCYDAFSDVYAIDKKDEWLSIMRSIATHTVEDLSEIEIDDETAIASYTPVDNRQVINSNSYRAQLLARASVELENPAYWEIGKRNLNYVLQNQSDDGSWIYATDGMGNFIDNFHTCFVMKHLYRIYHYTGDERCWNAIVNGNAYYRKVLLDEEGLPIPFAKPPRLIVYKRELYDYAECINLGLLLRGKLPEWNNIIERLLGDLTARWLKADGSFRSRKLRFGWDNCPMHRWAQSQLFRALTIYSLSDKLDIK